MFDLFAAMVTHYGDGPLSGRPLGNTANIHMWTPEKVQSFYNGIVVAHNNFFSRELELSDFARVIISESCQESTGNFSLNVKPINFTDYDGCGIIQVTPASVLLDYQRFGEPIPDLEGKVMLDPSTVTEIDLADPGLSIPIWAWYNKNTVLAGVSLNEWFHQKEWWVKPVNVTKDFGNCLYTWLAGPRHDRHTNDTGFLDYKNRVTDYWTVAGFGNQSHLDAIFNVSLETKMLFISSQVNGD